MSYWQLCAVGLLAVDASSPEVPEERDLAEVVDDLLVGPPNGPDEGNAAIEAP